PRRVLGFVDEERRRDELDALEDVDPGREERAALEARLAPRRPELPPPRCGAVHEREETRPQPDQGAGARRPAPGAPVATGVLLALSPRAVEERLRPLRAGEVARRDRRFDEDRNRDEVRGGGEGERSHAFSTSRPRAVRRRWKSEARS